MGESMEFEDGFSLKRCCRVVTNGKDDQFVGIRVDTSGGTVCFPLGFHLSEEESELRKDVRILIQVLSEFSEKQEQLFAPKSFSMTEKVDFPIHAFQTVIEYYFSMGGKYYVEVDPIYKTASGGKQDWGKTIKRQMPLVQRSKEGVTSFVYTDFTVRATSVNDSKRITQINRFCVHEAFRYVGWLYVPYTLEECGPHPSIKESLSVLQSKLLEVNDDKKRVLFQSMKDMLEFLDENTTQRNAYFGTDDFNLVWEKMVDTAFGEKEKSQYFPRTCWYLDYGEEFEKRPLLPDTIMIYKNKYYVLDAKCYKYGKTGDSKHLPNGTSISKQITYGEYLEKYMGIEDCVLFNAFVMPYDMEKNPFDLHTVVGTIGEAVGKWRKNLKYYERIQGIVLDTRYLMYHYAGYPEKEKAALAECIEGVIRRKAIKEP